MGFDKELTKQILGDVGPLRFNPKVVKVCQQCQKQNIVRYKGKKASAAYYCRKCIINRPETISKLSTNTTEQWKNTDIKTIVQKSNHKLWSNEELRARMSKMLHCPQIRAETITRNRSRKYDGIKISATMKKVWQNNEYRANILSHIINKRRTTAEVIEQLKTINGTNFDYTNTIYTNSHNKIEVRCNTCQKTSRVFIHNHIRHASCCYCQVSHGHRQMLDFIANCGTYQTLVNDRQTISPFELDIYLPDKALAIEYHGLFRHSYDHYPTSIEKLRHQQKALSCQSRNIKLLQVFSNEWDENRDIIESMIRYNLGLLPHIGARDCDIVTTTDRNFFNLNHLQGHRPARITFGLHYDGELVAAMSFGHHHKYQWEIIRYASKKDLIVAGGASRLFAMFVKSCLPTSIMTYADLRYSYGGLYQQLGFKRLGITKPNYHYTDKFSLFSRQSYQKHKLAAKLDHFDESRSEIENCLSNDLRLVYDAGHTKWLWTK